MTTFGVNWYPAPKPVGPRTEKSRTGWARYQAYRKAIGLVANSYFQAPLTGPVELSVDFFFPFVPPDKRYPGHDISNAVIAQSARAGRILPVAKPDLKNLVAAVEDSLTGIAWHDDSQVCVYLGCTKRYGVSAVAQTMICVTPLPDGLMSTSLSGGVSHETESQSDGENR